MVPTTKVRNTYTPDGVTTSFPYEFRIDSESDLHVFTYDYSTKVLIEFTLNVDYTVSGVKSENGGSIKFTTAPASGGIFKTLYVYRRTSLTQDTNYPYLGRFPHEAHENALDKLTQIVQDLEERLDRVITFPKTDLTTRSGEVPFETDRWNKLLGFDADGDATVYEAGDIIARSGTVVEYATVNAMQADSSISEYTTGQSILLKGYYAAGDFGEPVQLVVAVASAGVKSFTLADGRYANLYCADRINVNWFGAFASASNSTDQREMIQDAIDAARDSGVREVFFPSTDAATSRSEWYFVDSAHPTQTDYGLIIWENVHLVGHDHDGIQVQVKAGAGMSGKGALVCSDLTESTCEDIAIKHISFNANSQCEYAVKLGDTGSNSYVTDSMFYLVTAENGTAGGFYCNTFLASFKNCKSYHSNARSQSTWSPSDPANSGLLTGWNVQSATSTSFDVCYSNGWDIGWRIEDLVYSTFSNIAADSCELGYAMIGCENINIQGGCEANKMAFYASGAEQCVINLLGSELGTKTATKSTYSANDPDYFVQIEGSSIVTFIALNLAARQNTTSIIYDPAVAQIKINQNARVKFLNAGTNPVSRKFTNSSQTWVGLTPYRITPEMIDMPVTSGIINGGFSIDGIDGEMVYLDPAFYESFSVKTFLNYDSQGEVAYKDIFSLDALVKVQASIVFPDGNVGADFTEFSVKMEHRTNKWGTGTASSAGGTVNINQTNHGLATNDVIYCGVDTPYYEGKWYVQKIDDDNFYIWGNSGLSTAANFIASATTFNWASYAIKGSTSLIREGDYAANKVFNYSLATGPTSASSPWIRFYPTTCYNTMQAQGKVVAGYTYKIADLGATTSFDGSNVFPAGTGVTFGNGSAVVIADVGHKLTNGNAVVVSGTTSYNGTKYAKSLTADTWQLYDDAGLTTATAYVADEPGDYHTNVLNNVLVAKSTGYPTDWDTDAILVGQFSAAEIVASSDWSIRALATFIERTNRAEPRGIHRLRRRYVFAV